MLDPIANDYIKAVVRHRRTHVILGYACNHKCRYCIQAQDRPTGASKTVSQSTVELLKLAAEAVAPKYLNVMLFGGEPLLYASAIETLIKAVRATNVRWKMHTNGELLTPRFVDFFNDYGVRVGISHDGHNVLKTRGKDVFADEKIRSLFLRLKNASVDVVLTSYTQDLYAVRQWLCERLDSDDWRLKPALLINSGEIPKDMLNIDLAQWEQTVRIVCANALNQFKDGSTDNKDWERAWVERCIADSINVLPESPFIRFNERCLVPHINLAGVVTHCERLDGTLTRWQGEFPTVRLFDASFNRLVAERHFHCRNCTVFDWCRGQCPVANEAQTSPQCPMNRILFTHMAELAEELSENGLLRLAAEFPRGMLPEGLQSPIKRVFGRVMPILSAHRPVRNCK